MKNTEMIIFPFSPIESGSNLNFNLDGEERAVIRGSVCIKKHLDTSLVFSIDGNIVKPGSITYWHPIVQGEDYIKRGIELTKNGLN